MLDAMVFRRLDASSLEEDDGEDGESTERAVLAEAPSSSSCCSTAARFLPRPPPFFFPPRDAILNRMQTVKVKVPQFLILLPTMHLP